MRVIPFKQSRSSHIYIQHLQETLKATYNWFSDKHLPLHILAPLLSIEIELWTSVAEERWCDTNGDCADSSRTDLQCYYMHKHGAITLKHSHKQCISIVFWIRAIPSVNDHIYFGRILSLWHTESDRERVLYE